MPWGLKRFQESAQSHFVTFCCYHRRRLLAQDDSCRIFESALERVRRHCRLSIYGYVLMPDHVHLLLSEPQQDTLADALKSLKQGVSRRLIGDGEHFWQKRYCDFNIRSHEQFVEKLRYIHRNPGSPASPLLACWGGSRWRLGCAIVPRTGGGAASATTQRARKAA
jgi:putative transposase